MDDEITASRRKKRLTALVEERMFQNLSDGPTAGLRLQELCQRLNVSYRDARYICERNWLPAGVAREPGRGNHRHLSPRQAIWLGIVLKLKACGVRTEKAAGIAAFAERVKGLTRNACWDWPFSPFDGAFDTSHQWLLEVGEMRFFRFVTDANPSHVGLHYTPWVDMDSRQLAADVSPIVRLQVDLSALARMLRDLPREAR
jgi:hypothetical protein